MIEFEDHSEDIREALLRYLDGRDPGKHRRLDCICDVLVYLLIAAVLAEYLVVVYGARSWLFRK